MYESEQQSKKPEIKNMTKFAITAAVIALAGSAAGLSTVNNDSETQNTGSWNIPKETAITEEMNEIFDKATESLIGVDYEAVELIGIQTVSGTNYKFLAETQVVYPGAEKQMAVVTVYKDAAGNVSILDIENL